MSSRTSPRCSERAGSCLTLSLGLSHCFLALLAISEAAAPIHPLFLPRRSTDAPCACCHKRQK